jgi:hypothetical protein
MSRKPEVSENWFEDVCESMVRENLSLRKAAQLNGIALTEIEAQNVSRRLAFQACLKRHEYTYFEELGGDPRRTKHVLLGMMFYGIEKLMAEGAYKDAVSAGLQLAKVEYGTDGEATGALANLTAAEIAEVKKRIEALANAEEKIVEVSKSIN